VDFQFDIGLPGVEGLKGPSVNSDLVGQSTSKQALAQTWTNSLSTLKTIERFHKA
jgi:hypothetical protein